MVKVGINGFGRIGRNVLRAALGRSDFQVEAINDLTDSKTLAHLLKYDSLSGTLAAKVEAGEDRLLIDGRPKSRRNWQARQCFFQDMTLHDQPRVVVVLAAD